MAIRHRTQARSFEEVEQHIESLTARLTQIEDMTFEHSRRFDTLETPLWKRMWFLVDGWPGQKNLHAKSPQWRPWRRWYRS
jgi:hypothetical protein